MILPSVATTLLKRLAPIACCAALLSACGGHASIDPGATAGYVEGFVYQHTGFRATDVRCPSGVPATAGGRFNCHFTGPEGPYTAYMRILRRQGPPSPVRCQDPALELARTRYDDELTPGLPRQDPVMRNTG